MDSSVGTKAWRRLRRYVVTDGKPLINAASLYAAHLRRLLLRHTTFVAITGSCGKTTATQLVRAILARDGSSPIGADNNSESATARAVLHLPSDAKYCVQELSGDRPGKIARHVYALRPHIGIVTMVGSDHYKAFRSLEETAKEKGTLVEGLPAEGTAILNADDPHVLAMASRTRARVMTFGISPEADVRAHDISSAWPDLLTFTVSYGGESAEVCTQLPGNHWTPSVLAAIACGLACKLDLETCARAIEAVEPVFGRYSVHQVPGRPAFLLDTAKAPLWTVASGLSFLAAASAPRKTIVFGTLSDYAGNGSRTYRKVARQALAVADRVIFVGTQASHVEALRQDAGNRLRTYTNAYEASRFLAEESRAGELILVKASYTDHLERLALDQIDHVVCWREGCGKRRACPRCRQYRTPSPPPLRPGDVAANDEPVSEGALPDVVKAQ